MRLVDADAAIDAVVDELKRVPTNAIRAKMRIEALPSAQPDNQIHLCDSCDYSYPDCPSKNDDVIFGNGIGNDNICACNKYKPCAQSDIVKDLVTIFQNSKDMKLIARDGDLRADRIVFGRMLFEWIPCSERLPNEGITVLVTHKGGVSTAWHNGRYWERGASTNHRKLQTVVAWMPLPEPYGEKK